MSSEERTRGTRAHTDPGEKDANFAALTRNSATGIFVVQGERFVYINPAFTASTGYTLEDLSSMKFWDIVSPGMRELVKSIAAARQQTGNTAPTTYEATVITKSGEEKFARVDTTFVEFGRKPGILGSLTDLTERKLMEDALRASESKYRTIVENAIEGVYQTSPAGRYLSANPALARIHGYDTPEELLRDVGDLAGVHVDPAAYPRLKKLLDERSAVKNFECEVYRKDGRKRWISLNARTVRGPKGTILHYEGTAVDITERKDAEEKLRESEEKFRRYFDLGLIGMATTLPSKQILEVNDEICRILGYERSELLRMTWTELTHPDDVDADIASFSRVLAGEIDGYSMDKRFIGKNGRVVETTISVKCVRRPDGSIDYFLAMLQDVTQRRRAEEELKAREKELEKNALDLGEANAALKVLLKHREEDRTTLENAILTNVKALIFPSIEKLRQTQLADTQRMHLEVIESGLNEFISPFAQRMAAIYARFTPSEIQIANLIRNGKTSKEIAQLFNVSRATIETHRNNIRNKLGLRNNKNVSNLRSYLLSLT